MSKRFMIVLTLAFSLWRTSSARALQNESTIYLPRAVYTMSEVLDAVDAIALGVTLQAPLDVTFDRFDTDYLLPLINHLDFNVIGLGRAATIFPQQMIDYILEGLKQNRPLDEIGNSLIAEFQRMELEALLQQNLQRSEPQESQKEQTGVEPPRVNIGGFFVSEIEQHQEPDGSWFTLAEINQLRVFFSALINPSARKNRMSLLAEWNPVPEEVIHHIDEVFVVTGATVDTLSSLDTPVTGAELVQFEQLYFEAANLGGAGVHFRAGQFRLPFGLWSDVTSHRNFSSAKNNTLINGFALKKIDLGFMLEKEFPGGRLITALVHGRQGRTSNLSRADNDNRKDLALRALISRPGIQFGVSGYLAELKIDRNIALGADMVIPTRYVNITGEVVYQKNSDMRTTYGQAFQFKEGKTVSGYLSFAAALRPRVSFYGFYEGWTLWLDGHRIHNPAFKMFHGLRMAVNRNVRWTMAELGRMFHNSFDLGKWHIGSQLEVTF